MGIVLDLLVIAVIIIVAAISAKKGFVRTLIEVVGFIAACVITFTVSTPIAQFSYDKVIEPPMLAAIEKSAETQAESTTESLANKLPGFISNGLDKFGVTSESLTVDMASGAAQTAQTISRDVVRPVAVKIISMLCSVILMVVLLFVVQILARFINKLFSFSLVGKLNRTLGGIMGAAKGLLIAFVGCSVIGLIMLLMPEGFLIFTPEAVEGSYIFKALSSLNPFSFLM